MGTAYRVKFWTEFEATNGNFQVTKTLDLPFVPTTDMDIVELWQDSGTDEIEKVTYNFHRREFDVFLPSRTRHINQRLPFTLEYARFLIEQGCEVDDEVDPMAWKAKVLDLIEEGGREDESA